MIVVFRLHGAEDVVRQGVTAGNWKNQNPVLRLKHQNHSWFTVKSPNNHKTRRGIIDSHVWRQLKKVYTHVGIHLLLAVDIQLLVWIH